MTLPEWADAEFSALLPTLRQRGESQTLEFKHEIDENTQKLRKEIAAFASTNAGTILIDVDDNGDLIGVEPTSALSERRSFVSRLEGIAKGVSPSITLKIRFGVEAGKAVIAVDVPRGSQPVYYSNGVPYLRVITEAQPATPQDVIDRVRAWLEDPNRDQQVQAREVENFENASSALQSLAVDEHRGGVPEIVSRPRLILGFAPFSAASASNLSSGAVASAQAKFPPNMRTRVLEDCDGMKWWSCEPPVRKGTLPNPETSWLMRLVRPGYLEYQMTIGSRIDDEPQILVSGREIEGDIVFNLERMGTIMAGLGLDGPALCNIRFQGVEDVMLMHPKAPNRTVRQYEIPLSPVLIENPTDPIANYLQQSFDIIWQTAGWKEGSPSFGQGVWAGYSQQALYRRET